MANKKQLAAIRDLIITAEKSIKSAKKLLKDVLEENNLSLDTEINLETN
jgi:DNA polymerase III psi subunit